MAIFRITESSIDKLNETTFAQEKLLERRDLQRLIKADVSVLSPDLMVIAEEFGEWEDSNRRIDLLCLDNIDSEAHLVVVELETNRGRRTHGVAGDPLCRDGFEHDF